MVVVIASKNPVKIAAVTRGFQLSFSKTDTTFLSIDAPSNVNSQPLSDQETLLGAVNRAAFAQKLHPKSDFWVGLEAGVDLNFQPAISFSWVVILSSILSSKSRSASFELPIAIVNQLSSATELGQVMDHFINRRNTKQQEGAVGILSKGKITRAQLYTQPVQLALIPHINHHLYRETP